MKMKWLAVGIILLFVGTSIIPAIAQEAQKPLPASTGNWLYVGGSEPGNYSRIQDAIDNASNNDTIFVYSGMYVENLLINTTISLIGEDKNITIIDGSEEQHVHVVSVVADWVFISGFTIRNNSFDGAGIGLYSNCNTICDNILTNNRNGVYLEGHNNTVSHNIITYNDDGIYVFFTSSYNEVIGNTISDNYNSIWLYGDDNIIADNIIISNKHYALEVVSNRATILDNIISNHTFGIHIHDSSACNIIGNTISMNIWSGIEISKNSHSIIISDNIISHSNYGIRAYSSFNHNIIRDNTITLNKYQGIGISGNSSHNIISGNNLSKNGLGITFSWSTNYNNVSGNTIKWNLEKGIQLSTDSNNNNIVDNIIFSNGYGLFLDDFCGNNTITHNTISNNSVGIFLLISANNTISRNNLVYNKLNAFFVNDKNIWKGNFWNRPRFLPMVIFGISIKTFVGFQLMWPRIDIDSHPALNMILE